MRPLRAAGTFAAVLALLAGVAIPAYAATQPVAETVSLQAAAEEEAQSISVDASVESAPLTGAAYSATTPEEIAEAKAAAAAAAAAERAKEQAELLAQQQEEQESSSQPAETQDYEAPVAVNGLVNPLPAGSYSLGQGIEAAYRGHEGQDMLAPQDTPIYAVADGTVSTSGWVGGYGNGVYIEHVIDGVSVQTRYGHMVTTPLVSAGDVVTAGQIIGYVGSTGRSTANHLHVEVRVNGAVVDPRTYLPI